MRSLSLDYIRDRRLPGWVGLTVLVAALALSAFLGLHFRSLQNGLELYAMASGSDRAVGRRAAAAPVDAALSPQELKQINATVQQLALPWGRLFIAVEAAATPNIALLALSPDPQQRLLRISAEAKDQEAMLEFVRRLGATEGLSAVHLISHQVQAQDPQHPLAFSVQAIFLFQ